MRFKAAASAADLSRVERQRLAHEPRDTRQRLEVVAARVIGREKQEDEIHRLAILALEIDGLGQTGEERDDAGKDLSLTCGMASRGRGRSSPGAPDATARR